MNPNRPKMTTGSWLVIGLVCAGVMLALIALKFRRFPHEWQNPPPLAQPSTTATTTATTPSAPGK